MKYLLQDLITIFLYCSHPSIPEQKIQPVIPRETGMMQIVVTGSIDPPPDPGFFKTLRVQFKAKMPVHIVGNHKQEKQQNMRPVHR